ncbi:MAG TPA: hypothetical protein VE978_26245 [Chitinophagales bacterium]|nr:hypothetical protein [Chitinophagales bacterium]
MPILLDKKIYNSFRYNSEADFEKSVEQLADYIFGISSIYVSRKKRIKGSEIISIPDGYLIDFTIPDSPKLFIIENEIVSHDPFKHIGIQLLKFATSFEEARIDLRKYLMQVIHEDTKSLSRLEQACSNSKYRNIDSYLDAAVYSDFKAIVVIDEAREELHNVLQKINANISVLELKTFISGDGEFTFHFDTLYDDDEEADILIPTSPKESTSEDQQKRMKRRAQCDTIVVPAREDGFKRQFLGNNQWFAIRIGAAMKERIKYIAAYQVAPISAITHVAEVEAIVPYENTGKYMVKFKGPAKEIEPITLKNPDKKPQSSVYIRHSDLETAKSFDDLISY